MPAASRWRTRGTIRGRCRLTWSAEAVRQFESSKRAAAFKPRGNLAGNSPSERALGVEGPGTVLGHLLSGDDDLDPVAGLHLLHQLGHVVLDRLLGDAQRRGDLLVG